MYQTPRRASTASARAPVRPGVENLGGTTYPSIPSEQGLAWNVAREGLSQRPARRDVQRRPRAHSATDDDALRRDDEDRLRERVSEVAARELEHRVVVSEAIERLPRSARERRAGHQPFQAAPVERARTLERVERSVREGKARHREVTDLGVQKAVQRTVQDDDAAADSRSDRHIERRIGAPRGSPAMFGERGRVDVGVDGDGNAERVRQDLAHRDGVPSGLGCSERHAGRDVERTEHAHAERFDGMTREERDRGVERLARRRRRDALLADDHALLADRAEEFRAATLDGAEDRHPRATRGASTAGAARSSGKPSASRWATGSAHARASGARGR